MLREPVSKLVSYYKHVLKHMLISEIDIDTFVNEAHKRVNKGMSKEAIEADAIARSLRAGNYIHYLPEWYNVFPAEQIKVLFFEDLKKDALSLVRDTCQWLGLDTTAYDQAELAPENTGFTYQNRAVHTVAFRVSKLAKPLLKKLPGMRQRLRSAYTRMNKSKQSVTLSEEAKAGLMTYYGKQNKELRSFLEKKGITQFPGWLS